MEKKYRACNLIKRIAITAILFFVILAIPQNVVKSKAAIKHSKYVTNIKVKQSKNQVMVTYTAKTLPKGFRCAIVYGDKKGYYRKSQSIGSKGKHTVRFKKIGGISQISTELRATRYLSRESVKKIYNVKTGTTYHQVTKKEERLHKIASFAIGTGLGAISLHPALAAYSIQLWIAGQTYTVLKNFQYTPKYPNYIKMTSSFNQRNESIKTTVTVYSQKNSVKLKQWSTVTRIG